MKPPPPIPVLRWLPALVVWSAVLFSLLLKDQDRPAPVLAAAPCVPPHPAGPAG
jgi:hypothetical protein